jgi:dTDP-4-amino-4,6-dideoxygalactose transaminase
MCQEASTGSSPWLKRVNSIIEELVANEIIPFLDLISVHRELEDELVSASRLAFHSAAFIGGPEVEGFEREFANYCGTKYCIGVANGTDAVRFALMASGVGAGDAVLSVPNTFIATVEGISQAGADTEFIDIDERTFTMSPERLADYLASCTTDPRSGRPMGRRTGKPIRAIVPVHLYGQVADMNAITEVAERYGLFVIEDSAQAHGAEYLDRDQVWRRAGSFGKAAAFSFYPGKNLGACGEAGAVTTDDENVATQVRMLREHGQAQKYYHELEGYNGRLDALQAAFLRIKLRHLDKWTGQRRVAARRYNSLLSAIGNVEESLIPYEPDWSRAVYHLYVIRAKERDALAAHLKANGIQTGLHYPLPLHRQKCYLGWGYAQGTFPVTERVAAEILSLPMFPGLTDEQQRRVAAAIGAFRAGRSSTAMRGTRSVAAVHIAAP